MYRYIHLHILLSLNWILYFCVRIFWILKTENYTEDHSVLRLMEREMWYCVTKVVPVIGEMLPLDWGLVYFKRWFNSMICVQLALGKFLLPPLLLSPKVTFTFVHARHKYLWTLTAQLKSQSPLSSFCFSSKWEDWVQTWCLWVRHVDWQASVYLASVSPGRKVLFLSLPGWGDLIKQYELVVLACLVLMQVAWYPHRHFFGLALGVTVHLCLSSWDSVGSLE